MHNVVLASGPITSSDDLVVELVTPADAPAAALAAIAVLDDAMQQLSRTDGQPR